ncbi:MAG: RDD family protein [Chloroflexi bacterium]|nr:MAG: RDD family protein [Chloroflexota bacterium]
MSQLDEKLLIDTPENITFGYEIAGIGSRFLAALVDTTLIVLLQILVNGLLLLVISSSLDLGEALRSGDFGGTSISWVIALMGLISFFFFWGYYIFFEMLWNGQSPGKSLTKLRVIRADGLPVTLTESIVRNLVRLIDFLPIYYGIGVVTMFINHQSRRLGDLAAGTLVVRESAAGISLKSLEPQEIRLPRPEVAPGNSSSTDQTPASYPVDRLSAQDIQMIEAFLSRRGDLNNRRALALQLACALLSRMGLPADQLKEAEAEESLAAILRTYRARME